MRRATLTKLGLYAALFVLLQGAKCPSVPSSKKLTMAVVAEDYIELTFQARGETNVLNELSSVTVDLIGLRDDLDAAEVPYGSISAVNVSSVMYGVVAIGPGESDRAIENASVTVAWDYPDADGGTLFDVASQPVAPLLGLLVPAPLQPGGIDVINRAAADLLAALNSSEATFTMSAHTTGVSTPVENPTNFDYRVRIYYSLTCPTEVEVYDI
jgi:hypothetical protein